MTTSTTTARPQCQATLESHGRHWRCTRPAAKKHGNKYCGHCAPKPPRCGGNSMFTYHRADCAGCSSACCSDASLHVAGRCLEYGTLRPISPSVVTS